MVRLRVLAWLTAQHSCSADMSASICCALRMWHAAVLLAERRSLFCKLLIALFARVFPLLSESSYDKKLFWRKAGLSALDTLR